MRDEPFYLHFNLQRPTGKQLLLWGLFSVLTVFLSGAVLPDLPPRPTPVTTTTLEAGSIEGGFIELQLGAAWAGVDTLVQWQAAGGEWYDVASWFGQTEADGSKRWWVASRDFATGPFRWVVLDEAGDMVLASEPFMMPAHHGEIVTTAVDD